MKYLLSLFALLFLFPSLSNAQSYYKPGYYINNHADTVKGYVEYREKYNNPKVFNFKADLSKAAEKVSLNDASAVEITGFDHFEKFVAPVSKAYISLSMLTTTPDSSFTTDTVFLRLVKKGVNVAMYSYTDRVKTRFYVVENADKKAIELNYYVYLDENTRSAVPEYAYRMQLLSLVNKYKPANTKINSQLHNTRYDEGDIYKIVQVINGSNDAQVTSESAPGTRFFLGLGGKETKLTFKGQPKGTIGGPSVFYEGTNRSSFSPTLSGGIDLFLNKSTQKLIIRAEVSFFTASYNIDNENVSFDGTTASLDFKQYTATINPQIIYNFYSTDKLKVFLNFGLGINFSAYNNYNYTTVYKIGTSGVVNTITKNKYPVFNKVWPSFPIKAGVVVSKHIEIYAGYLPASEIASKYNTLSVQVASYQGGINYLFGK